MKQQAHIADRQLCHFADFFVAEVALETDTLLTVMSFPADTLIPDTKFVPVIVMLTDEPAVPLFGIMAVMVGLWVAGGTVEVGELPNEVAGIVVNALPVYFSPMT